MNLSPLIQVFFKSSRSHPLRTVLLIFGIALGVAGVIAVDIARTSVSKSFDLSTASLTSRSTHQIMGTDFTLPQSLFTRVRTQLGIKKSAPVISRLVKAVQMDNQAMTLMGIDPFSEAYFREIRVPKASRDENLRTAMIEGQGVVMDRETAEFYGLDQGDDLTLLLGGRAVETRIAALLDDTANSGFFQGVIMADIALAQEILDMGNRITRIDLILDSPEQVEWVRAILEPGQVLVKTDLRNGTIRSLSLSFETSLTAFSMLVLFMGLFLIYNTVSFSVASRRQLNGTLRALGATQNEIFWAVEAEVFAYALVGSVLGIGLGILLGKGAVHAVCATVSDMYYTLTVSQTHIRGITLVKGGVTGLLAALFSSVIPALNAANTRPVTLMQASAPERNLSGYLPWLTAAGVLFMGIALFIFHGRTAGMGMVFAGVFMVFAGGSLMTPALVSGLTRLLDITAGNHGCRNWIMARMALKNIQRSLSRTSVLIASLMVVISVYIGIGTMTESFRQSIIGWVDANIGGDIHLAAMDELRPSLEKGLLDRIETMEEVENVSAYNIHRRFSSRSGEVHIFSYIKDSSKKEWTWLCPGAGQGDDQAIKGLLDRGWILVSEIFAQRHGLAPEATVGPGKKMEVVMETRQGPTYFKVAGVFRDFFMGGGRVVVSRDTMKAYWGKDDITAMQIFLSGDNAGDKASSIRRMIPKIRQMSSHPGMLRIRSGPEIKARILSVFDKTFLITIALQALTALVALTGIINSVMALILERSRELGILRACGAEPSQVRTLVLWECGVSGFLAGLLALPMGMFLSWILVDVVNFRSFGWTYEIQFSAAILLQALGFATLAALGAGLVPAVNAGRVQVSDALRTQ